MSEVQTMGEAASHDVSQQTPEVRADTLSMLAFTAQRRGDRTAALSLMQRALQEEPHNAQRHIDLALMALELGAYYEAIAHFEAVLAGCGELPVALLGLGRALMEAKQWELAADRLERAVHAAPSSASAWSELGQVYIELGRHEAAMSALEAAAKHAPDDTRIVRRLAKALLLAGRPQHAEPIIANVVRDNPSDADACALLGDILLALGHSRDALSHHRRAAALEPDVEAFQHGLANTELAIGHFGEAWSRRVQTTRRRQALEDLTLWNGDRDNSATLLVHESQSAADTLLLSRYLKHASSKVNRVVFRCRSERAALFARSFPELVIDDDSQEVEHEATCTASLECLPGLLDVVEPQTFEGSYLQADGLSAEAIRQRKQGRRLHVGLCWKGFEEPSESHHAMHLSRLVPILSMDQICCVSLQRGAASAQAQSLPPHFALQTPQSFAGVACSDLDQVASVISALDLVITVDGEVAHLAGALGRPTWVMLASMPRPYWGLTERNWYSNVRVFRQERRNDFAGVVREVQSELRRCVGDASRH